MKLLRLLKKYFLTSQPASSPEKQKDFAIHLEPVDLASYKAALQRTGFDLKVIECISCKGQPYEVFQLDINPQARKRLLIFAGVHGNEFAATLAVTDILQDIRRQPNLYQDWHIRIVTPLNPVGLVHQSRYNETGHDINRDFKEFATAGGKLQKQVMEDFKPNFIISLHEGPQDGFFVIAERSVSKKLQPCITKALTSSGIHLAQKNFLGLHNSQGYWRKPSLAYFVQKLLGIYTLGRYTCERNIPQLTTESDWKITGVTERRRGHVIVVRAVVESW